MTDPLDEDRPRLAKHGRARYAPTSADQRLSRPLVIALVGVVAVAAILFWPRGGGGLRLRDDDPVHVVRVDTTVAAPVPQSGDVDVTTAQPPLVPEAPSREPTTDRDRPLTITSRTEPGEVPTTPSPEPAPATPAVEPAPIAQPTKDGGYALQVASFESELGAQTLRDDLMVKGYPVHVRAASTANGAIVYRVWVGYFQNREAAAAFAGAHQEALAGATPVHR
jgi:cell division septation protein DedD